MLLVVLGIVIRRGGIDVRFIIQVFATCATIGTVPKIMLWVAAILLQAQHPPAPPSGTDCVLASGAFLAIIFSSVQELIAMLAKDSAQPSAASQTQPSVASQAQPKGALAKILQAVQRWLPSTANATPRVAPDDAGLLPVRSEPAPSEKADSSVNSPGGLAVTDAPQVPPAEK